MSRIWTTDELAKLRELWARTTGDIHRRTTAVRRSNCMRHRSHRVIRIMAARLGLPYDRPDRSTKKRLGLLRGVSQTTPKKKPTHPCTHPPGSEERIKVLARRAASGQHLWHPEDLRLSLE